MTHTLYEDQHIFMAALVTNVGNHGDCGHLVPWLPLVPIFHGCCGFVVASEAFCTASSYCLVIIMVGCIIWVQFKIH